MMTTSFDSCQTPRQSGQEEVHTDFHFPNFITAHARLVTYRLPCLSRELNMPRLLDAHQRANFFDYRKQVAVYVVVLVLTLAAATFGCRTAPTKEGQAPTVQPGAPGEPTRVIAPEQAAVMRGPGFTAADVAFMQGMIHHHAQALDMTNLLATQSTDPDMKKLAQRIELSQADEIKMMQEWLKSRGQQVPSEHAHHAAGAKLMPGMLTPAEMSRLGAASGREFDRLFLEYMIKHHMGALTMVRELFASPGAGQDSEIYAFASDVDADQRMEIDRMGAMLRERQQ
jgi:uncharacterized protein (DUF305 family)